MPEDLVTLSRKLVRNHKHFSRHSKENLNKDWPHTAERNRVFEVLSDLQNYPVDPFEVYTDDSGRLLKYCMRTPYNLTHDITFVFSATTESIITFWLNDALDSHKTLDASLYSTS